MSQQHTRTVSFAGSSLTLQFNDPRFASLIDFLYGQVNLNRAAESPQRPVYRLQADADELTLYRDNIRLYQGNSIARLADVLLGNSCHHLADQSRGGLLFHAGAVERHSSGVILPGTMGAGKTTLTAWLLTRGFNYLSDEMVFVPNGADTIRALPRPLNLKKPSRPVLQPWLDFEAQADKIISTAHVDLASPTLLRPETQVSEPPLSLIVFPRFKANVTFELTPLSKAQAGKALMECLINARNLSDHGFAEITRLARLAPAYRMTYANFEQVGDAVEKLLDG